jgi:hypothetical protein
VLFLVLTNAAFRDLIIHLLEPNILILEHRGGKIRDLEPIRAWIERGAIQYLGISSVR